MTTIEAQHLEAQACGRTGLWAVGRPTLDIVVTVIASGALLPALRLGNLPFATDWKGLAGNYVVLAFQAVVLSAALWCIQAPRVISEVVREHWEKKPKLLLMALFSTTLFVLFGIRVAIPAGIAVLAITDCARRSREVPGRFNRQALRVLASGGYFLLGFLFVVFYSTVVVRLRSFGAYDSFFNNLDLRLFGTTVSSAAHEAKKILPGWCFAAFSAVYFGMFAQIGAAIVLCGVMDEGHKARQFVGAVLVAYCLTVLIYFTLPSYGPYRLCPNHSQQTLSKNEMVETDAVQRTLIANAEFLSSGKPVRQVPIAYYIAFPCMHLVQPLIVLWFLRRWKRIFVLLAIYDVLLVASIVLLELHFFADLVAAVFVAGIAILLLDPEARSQWLPHPQYSHWLSRAAK